MAWEISLIVQIGWAAAVSTDAIAARMYPFIWLPAKEITHSQYDVLYALEVGIGILIGGYAMGWLSDKIGRRPSLVLSSVLAALFILPFAYVTNYPALAILSIGSTLGIGGYLAINVVYMSEIMGPTVRPRVMMVSQTVCIFLLLVILGGIIPHYWFPSQYKAYLWLLAGLNVLVAIDCWCFRMPESPRWLEARERRDAARKVVERMETRASRGGRARCPNPTWRRTRWWPRKRPAGWRRSAGSTWWPPYSCWWSWRSATPASCTAATARSSCSSSVTAATAPAPSSPSRPGPGWPPPRSTCSTRSSAAGSSASTPSCSGPSCSPAPTGACTPRTATRAVTTFFILANVGGILWLWSMYVYIPNNYPTRMRSLGTGWTDGMGHVGAWGGVLIAGQLFSMASPRGFFLFVTIPCAILPGLLLADLRQAPAPEGAGRAGPLDAGPSAGCRRLFPEVSPAVGRVSPAAQSTTVGLPSVRNWREAGACPGVSALPSGAAGGRGPADAGNRARRHFRHS